MFLCCYWKFQNTIRMVHHMRYSGLKLINELKQNLWFVLTHYVIELLRLVHELRNPIFYLIFLFFI